MGTARQGAIRVKLLPSCATERLHTHGKKYVCVSALSAEDLETATTATTLPAGAISGDGGHVLDTANLHARTRERTESSLGTGARGLGLVAASGAQLDVESGDANLLRIGR